MMYFQTVFCQVYLLQTDMNKKAKALAKKLDRPIVMVGMMGTGKSRIGQVLAGAMGLEFVDSDHRIVEHSGYSIAEIFEKYGEAEFRRVEKRVIENLLSDGKLRVLALGGGAIMNADTAACVKRHAYSVWVQAPMDHILARVAQNQDRPLLACDDPKSVLEKLMQERKMHYAQADCHVMNEDGRADRTIRHILSCLDKII